jgi:hypothetical protein
MTKAELLAALAEYPDDTPVFDGRGYDLRLSSVTPMNYDDWSQSTVDDEGWEVPAVGVGISIGRRF